MKRTHVSFLSGLGLGLAAWCVTDRVLAHRAEQRYVSEMAKYEEAGFLDEAPQLDLNALLEIELTDALTGKSVTMQESRGRVIFLNLWATWCDPCLRELPSIAALHRQVGDRVAFYLLSDERDLQAVQEFARSQADDLRYYSYESRGTTLEPFVREGIPRTFVIHEGKVLIDHLGAAPWDSERVLDVLNEL